MGENEQNEIKQEETSIPAAAPEAPTSGPTKKKTRSGMWGLGVIVLLVLAFGAMQVFGLLGKNGSDISDKAASVDPSTLVANVNGVAVTRGELDQKLDQVRSTIPEGAADPTADAGFELQLLDEIINLKLLTAQAEAEGIEVSDEQVNTELTTLIDAFGGEDAFQAQLETTGITRDELVDNMHAELMIQQLLNQKTDLENVTVTDEEIKDTYDQAVADAPDAESVPPMDQVEELLRSRLLQQKQAAIVQDYIAALRADADIQVLL